MPALLPRLLPLALVLAAAPVAAQAPVRPAPAVPAQRPTFTPFVGYQFGWTRSLEAVLVVDGVERRALYEDRSEGGSAAGIKMSVPLRVFTPLPSLDGIALVAAVALSRASGGYTIVTLKDSVGGSDADAFAAQPEADVTLVKLGVGLRLPMALPGDLILAPSVVHIAPRDEATDPLHRTGPVVHPGLNFGLDFDLPTRIRGVSLQVAGEDNILYANSELARRVDRHYARERCDYGRDRCDCTHERCAATRSRYPRTISYVALLRAGVSIHF